MHSVPDPWYPSLHSQVGPWIRFLHVAFEWQDTPAHVPSAANKQKKTITQNKTNTQAKNCLPLKIKVKTNSPLRCVADSIKVALGVGKLLFGFHSSKSLHYSICPNDQLPKQPFFDLAVYDSEAIGQNWKFFTTPLSELKYKILIFWILYALLSLRFTRICYMSMTTIF